MTHTEQRSDAWHQERVGIPTASRLGDMLSVLKNGAKSQKYIDYFNEKLVERLTGNRVETYTNEAMRWGTHHEDAAISMYETQTFSTVERTGLITLDINGLHKFGASPDGLLHDKAIEVKCPFNSIRHLNVIENGESAIDEAYILQMQGVMLVTGKQLCDFITYDPRMPDHLQIHVVTIKRDDDIINRIINAVIDFSVALDEKQAFFLEKGKK